MSLSIQIRLGTYNDLSKRATLNLAPVMLTLSDDSKSKPSFSLCRMEKPHIM